MSSKYRDNFLAVALNRKRRFVHRLRISWHRVVSGAIRAARAGMAIVLVYCLIPFSVADLSAQGVPPTTGPGYRQLTYEQLDQLVAPIALYPDALVAQILAAATYPPQIAEADHFVERNPGLPPEQLARMADSQPWDPSVKALTAFPTVLSQLNRNLDWTAKLGNAYYNQPQDVMGAVQTMRQRAYAAGTLRPTPHESVVYQPATIVIQPVNPAVVYVPVYNPWIVYGAPVPVYPAYYYVAPPPPPHTTGNVALVAAVSFAAGVVVGSFLHYGWGWNHWGCAWGPHPVVAYNHVTYVSRSVTVINHGYYGGFDHTVAARSWNQQTVYGPRGGVYTDQRSVINGQYNNTRTAIGPHGATYSDQRTVGDGQLTNTRTATKPNGASYTDQHSVTDGQSTSTRTATGANGKTVIATTTRDANGNSATVTGPNGQTVTRTVTGRGTGDATVTRSGPNGTRTRQRHRRPE